MTGAEKETIDQEKQSISRSHTAPEEQRDELIAERRVKIPPMYVGAWDRAIEGTCSPRAAIKAKCQDCVGWENTTAEIRGCLVRLCPLWKYRPYQIKDASK